MKITPDILLDAYRNGLFPMAESRDAPEMFWMDPPRRGILPLESFRVPRRLQRTIRRQDFRITFDREFPAVIAACAAARQDTWINAEIVELYTELHRRGRAHSAEAWKDGALAGGLYGIALGGAFFGESMFSTQTDASKTALVHLAARLWRRGFTLLDAQFRNPHLEQFGLAEIPRTDYKKRLAAALEKDVSFGTATDHESGLPADVAAFLQARQG